MQKKLILQDQQVAQVFTALINDIVNVKSLNGPESYLM